MVLMDMQMPEMGGIEATRRIRAFWGADLPIVAMTANAYQDDRDACFRAGMNDFVVKPFSAELLQSCLLRWLVRSSESASPGWKPELVRATSG